MIRELINEAVEEILEKEKLEPCPKGKKRVGKACKPLSKKEKEAKREREKEEKAVKKKTCGKGQRAFLIKGKPKCIKLKTCGKDQTFNPTLRKCVKECPIGKRFDSDAKKCVKTKTKH